MQRDVMNMSMACAAIAALSLCFSASARAVVPVSQQRTVSAFVIVPPCPDGTASNNQAASNFQFFNATAEIERSCEAASGIATATQESDMSGFGFNASGETNSQSSAVSPTVIHAISSSLFEVTFNVTAQSRFVLEGQLEASGGLPVVVCNAQVRLMQGSDVLLQQTVNPLAGGTPNSIRLDDDGYLEPGQYTIRASAFTGIDGYSPPDGLGEASYEMTLGIAPLGDVNGDGYINVMDLLIVLGSWGPCPAPPQSCIADIAPLGGDGMVDVNDLLVVIGQWAP